MGWDHVAENWKRPTAIAAPRAAPDPGALAPPLSSPTQPA